MCSYLLSSLAEAFWMERSRVHASGTATTQMYGDTGDQRHDTISGTIFDDPSAGDRAPPGTPRGPLAPPPTSILSAIHESTPHHVLAGIAAFPSDPRPRSSGDAAGRADEDGADMALVNGTPVIAMWTTTSSDRAGKYCGAARIGSGHPAAIDSLCGATTPQKQNRDHVGRGTTRHQMRRRGFHTRTPRPLPPAPTPPWRGRSSPGAQRAGQPIDGFPLDTKSRGTQPLKPKGAPGGRNRFAASARPFLTPWCER